MKSRVELAAFLLLSCWAVSRSDPDSDYYILQEEEPAHPVILATQAPDNNIQPPGGGQSRFHRDHSYQCLIH